MTIALIVLPGRPSEREAISPFDGMPTPSGASDQGESEDDPTTPTLDTVRDIRAELDADAAARYDNPIDPDRVAAVVTRPGPYVPMGTIQIPAIGLDVEYGSGVHEAALVHGPGHWPGTPAPGQPGNPVISGHRNTHTQPFKKLDQVEVGDVIIASAYGGPATEYTVFNTVIVPEAEYEDYVLQQPDDPTVREITVFACHPEGNPVNRIIVQARA
ncbi:class E sortase [Jiangella alkaliphila]|uniref:class E sortase n=1 Tax=Jiangella alkaliphila TaxID=419479 RepID=UPI00136499E8|nr:class E sortase [Jiangella alkaliphila]